MQPNSKVEKAVAALANLSRDQLAARWARTYGHPPPKGIGRKLLQVSAAWHLQRKVYGGLSPEARRLLNRAMADFERQLGDRRPLREQRRLTRLEAASLTHVSADRESECGSPSDPGFLKEEAESKGKRECRAPLHPGARLIREWKARQYIVAVAEKGFVFDGKTYRSLSAVARKITGTQWSGPRFFGL